MNVDVNSGEPKWEFSDNKGKKTAQTKIQLPYGLYSIRLDITGVSDDQLPIVLRDIVSRVKRSVLGMDPNASPGRRVPFTPETEYSYSKHEKYKPPTVWEGLTIEEREELEAITDKKLDMRTPQEVLRFEELMKKGKARLLYESRVSWDKQPEDIPVAYRLKKEARDSPKQKPLTAPDDPEKMEQLELAASSARYFALLTTDEPFSKAEWSDLKDYPIFFLDVEELNALKNRLAEVENTVPESEKELWETLNGKIYHCLKAKDTLNRFIALAHRLLQRSRKRSIAQLCDKNLASRRRALISKLEKESQKMQREIAEFLPKNMWRVEMDSGMMRLYFGTIEECNLLIHELVRLQSSIIAILAEDVFLKSNNENWELQIHSFLRHYGSKYVPELKTKLEELLQKKTPSQE